MAKLTPEQQQKLMEAINVLKNLKHSDPHLHNFILDRIKNYKTSTIKYAQGDHNTVNATSIDGTSNKIGQIVDILTRHTSDYA